MKFLAELFRNCEPLGYHARRARQEWQMARHARCPMARQRHEQLAQTHEIAAMENG